MSGGVCSVQFLIEAVFAVCDITKVFDPVVARVLVLVVDFVSWPMPVNDEPDKSVGFVSFPIETDSSVSVSV